MLDRQVVPARPAAHRAAAPTQRVAESDPRATLVLALQRTAGNGATARMLARAPTPAEPVVAAFEQPLNADFSDVRLETSSREAVEYGARAFARGSEIHVAPGQYRPDTPDGRALIGHELAHVVQQREGRATGSVQMSGARWCVSPELEAEADRLGHAAAAGRLARPGQAHSAPRPVAADVAQGVFEATWNKQWSIKGRPEFPSATKSGIPVDAGDHRAHSASWEGIRQNVQDMLNSDGSFDHVYEVALIHVLEPLAPEAGGFDVEAAFASLQSIRTSGLHNDAAASEIKRILTGLNGLLQNLDEGHGSTNSSIQGYYDPKVVASQGGFDLRPEDRDAIRFVAQQYKGLLLDKSATVIYASTFDAGKVRGRIPVADARGVLREMIDGQWFVKKK